MSPEATLWTCFGLLAVSAGLLVYACTRVASEEERNLEEAERNEQSLAGPTVGELLERNKRKRRWME